MRHGAAVSVEHSTADDDALAERIAGVLTGEVVIGLRNLFVAEDGAGHFRKSMRQVDERLRGGAARGGTVACIIGLRLRSGFGAAIGNDLRRRFLVRRWNGRG